MRERPPGSGLPRRELLRALAVAPVALAGCAAGRAAPPATPEGAVAAPGHPPPAPVAPGAVAAVRAFRLAADAEPAFVFRAAAARTEEPR